MTRCCLYVKLVVMTKTKDRASQIRKRLREIQGSIKEALDKVMGQRELLRGYAYRSKRRCGKASCQCSQGKLHEAWVLAANVDGKRTTRSLSGERGRRVAHLAANYRRFREAQRSFRRGYEEALSLMRELEELMIVETYGTKKGRRKK